MADITWLSHVVYCKWVLTVFSDSFSRDPYRYKIRKELFVACEGMYTGQFIYCGKKAHLTVGNVMPIGIMPEGTIISNLEEKVSVY